MAGYRDFEPLPPEPLFDLDDEVIGEEEVNFAQAAARRALGPNLTKREKAQAKRQKAVKKAMRGYEVTPAQRVMREDMAAVDADGRFLHHSKLSTVLDEAFGPVKADATDLALQVIEEMGPGLQLGFAEWRQVQEMIETGIRLGYDRGLNDEALIG